MAQNGKNWLNVTIATLGAAMTFMCAHGAKASDRAAEKPTASKDSQITADLNLRQLTGTPIARPAAQPVAVQPAAVSMTLPQANQKVLPDVALIAMSQAMDPGNPLAVAPQRLNNVGLSVVALTTAVNATKGTFTGQLRDTDPFFVISTNLLIARVESRFDPAVSAPASAFRNAFRRADRPAGLFQMTGVLFATKLSAHMDDITLSDGQRRVVQPTFDTLTNMASRYAATHKRNVNDVLATEWMMGEAYMAAPESQRNAVRFARIDPTPVEGVGGTTTKGMLLSSYARVYLQDEERAAPVTIAMKYSNAAWSYMQHVWGPGGATQIATGNVKSQRNAMAQNPSATHGKKTAGGILQAMMTDQFSNLDPLTDVVKDTLSGVVGTVQQFAPTRASTARVTFNVPVYSPNY